MRIITIMCFYFILSYPLFSNADIHQWTDDKGRIHFSDTPPINTQTAVKTTSTNYPQVYSQGKSFSSRDQSTKSLNRAAKSMKKLRLSREKEAKKAFNEKRKKRLKNEKRIAKIKKKKLACATARRNQDAAFRQRTKSHNLAGMRRSLDNYEKKRAIRAAKCK